MLCWWHFHQFQVFSAAFAFRYLIRIHICVIQAMYPSIQAKIWGNMGKVTELVDTVLDSFIKVSRLYNCLFIIQLLYGFRVWMAWSKHARMLRELRKARETRAEGEWFCALFLTRASYLDRLLLDMIEVNKQTLNDWSGSNSWLFDCLFID
jgi:hypothetical protein